MQANLDASFGLLNSQSVLTALLAKGGLQREEAYALVQRNAMAAWEEQRPFIELLKSDSDITDVLDPDEIERCFDPARYLRHAPVIFERLEAL
jgi:adenylosuccinate lyase